MKAKTLLPKDTNVVILCGGRGSRLRSLTQETPKALLNIGESPFLLHLLRRLQKEGFERFVLASGYLGHQFKKFAKDYSQWFPKIEVVIEEKFLGTGGAIKNVVPHVSSQNFIALNGDVFVTQPLWPVLLHHIAKKNVFTLVAVKSENVEGPLHNKGGLKLSAEDEVLNFRGHACVNENWVNAGCYVIQREKILSWPNARYDLETELSSLLSPNQAKVFRSEAKLLDIGSPECFHLAQERYEFYQ